MNRKEKMAIICASVIILLISNVIASNYIVKKEAGPGYVEETKVEEPIVGTKIISVASDSNIYIHDGIAYVKGEDKGRFSLSGYCACTKCGTGTGITACGKLLEKMDRYMTEFM